MSNGPTDDDLVGIFEGETIVTVVKDDFDWLLIRIVVFVFVYGDVEELESLT